LGVRRLRDLRRAFDNFFASRQGKRKGARGRLPSVCGLVMDRDLNAAIHLEPFGHAA
jgi:transposase